MRDGFSVAMKNAREKNKSCLYYQMGFSLVLKLESISHPGHKPSSIKWVQVHRLKYGMHWVADNEFCILIWTLWSVLEGSRSPQKSTKKSMFGRQLQFWLSTFKVWFFRRKHGIQWWNTDFTMGRVRMIRSLPLLESWVIRFEEWLKFSWRALALADFEQRVRENYFHED